MARRTRRLSFLAVVLGVLLPAAADSAQKPDPRDRVLPNFDIRLQTPRVAPALDADAQKQLEELDAIVPACAHAHTATRRESAPSPRMAGR